MPDFDAIARESLAALAEAEQQHSPLAAAFLRVRVPELIKSARDHRDCRECEHHPNNVTPTTRRHKHG